MVSVKSYRRAIPFVVAVALLFGRRIYAEIVYTPVNISVTGTGILKIDFNHDGVTDVSIVASGGSSHVCGGQFQISAHGNVYALPAGGNATVANGNLVRALNSGAKISSSSSFYSAEGVMLQYNTCLRTNSGAWQNVSNHYLGTRFQINGRTHYGWARLTVSEGQSGPTVTLTGHAYESVANASITAGQTTVVSSGITLKVTSPLNDSTVTNPVHIVATASGPNPISQIQVWVNYKEVFHVSGGSLNANVTLPVGSNERFVVQAVDSKGNSAKVIYSITVNGVTGKCTPVGMQCPSVFPPCCPGLVCVPASTRAFCEPAGAKNFSTDPWYRQASAGVGVWPILKDRLPDTTW